MPSLSTALCVFTLLGGLVDIVGAYTIAYCSSQNTGSGDQRPTYYLNSYLTCSGNCSGYAYGVLQYQSCWCSDYAPSVQDSIGRCAQGCPGFPSDNCGNQDPSLFAYLVLDSPPSGTIGAQTNSPTPQSSQVKTSSSPSPSSTNDLRTSSTYLGSSTSSTSSNTHASHVTSVKTFTKSGAVTTHTVTSDPNPSANTLGASHNGESQHKSLSGGAIAGIVIGVIAGIALLAAIGFFLVVRRRRDDEDEDVVGGAAGAEPGAKKKKPRRNTSVLSRTGLLSRGRQSMIETNNYEEPNSTVGGTTANSARQSVLYGVGSSVDPSSPIGSSHDAGSTRRPSKPLVYDQRLNPSALFANHDNGSRVSMQDNNDYSRPLGIANPDPRLSIDSRRSNWD